MANDYIVINDDLRTMHIPSSIAILGVESDDDVNKIPFTMPKEYCGFDLSEFEARINYMNPNGTGDLYIVDDLAVDGDNMTFTWLVGRNACAYKGNTKFIVCLKKFDDDQNVVQEFNTTVYNLPVLEGLETTEAVVQQNPDIIEYMLKLIEEAGIIDLDDYYTKEQVNALKLANPYKLNINGTEYDGSQPVEMTIDGGSTASTETASGTIVHVTDAVPNEEVKSLTLLDENGEEISSAVIAVTNKNLYRIDLLPQQTVNKGITFDKASDGSIHGTGTSTGTYASAQVNLDQSMFVEGETYTLSSGKKVSGSLYVQLILNYEDNTTDYIVSNSTPYTFSIGKKVTSAIGSIQVTNSGVTVDEWVYPMLELSDSASAFVNNVFNSMTYTGATKPTLPDSISNVWSTNASVDNIIMEYWNDPVLAQVNELEKQFYQTINHDDHLDANSEAAVQNKVVTAAINAKANMQDVTAALANKMQAASNSGATGQILRRTNQGHEWQDVIDSALSTTSENAVQNKVVTNALSAIVDDVSDHGEAITENTTDIAQNTADIAQNASDIAQNTSNISANATAIALNSHAISELEAVEDLTSQLTLTSYVNNAKLFRNGKMMFLRFELLSTLSSGSWETLLTLPNDYAPSYDIACAYANYSRTDAGKQVELMVRSNSQVRGYLVSALSSSGYMICSATWMID